MNVVRYVITFAGRVQGVGFRFTTCRVAGRFPVAGWVRNEPDGTVRCVVEGEKHELDRFVNAVEQMMGRHISRTDIDRQQATGEFSGFGVRY